jgi:cobalt-zinc-cadmium efflux system protein
LSNINRLKLALGISLFILVMEVIGGLVSHSLALLSDAGHVLTDAFALGLSLIALTISQRPSDFRATFGYQRLGMLAAVINGSTLLIIAVYIFYEAVKRFMNPVEVDAPVMITVAVLGLIGNGVMALILGKGHQDLNIKSAWLHIIGDLLASVGVVVAAVVIYFTGLRIADPIAGALVGILILIGGIRVVRDALWVFLEFVPSGIDVREITKRVSEIPGVQGIHDVHLWAISHGTPAFSAHIWINDQRLSEADSLRKKIEEILKEYGIVHTVLQLECAECAQNGLFCQVRIRDEHRHSH